MPSAIASLESQELIPVCRSRAVLRRVLQDLRRTDYADLLGSRRRREPDVIERRAFDRFSIRVPIRVKPVLYDGDNVEILDSRLLVIDATTKDLTLRGVGFTHREPLCGDYVALQCELLRRRNISVLVELRRSNTRHESVFLSGGRFEALVENWIRPPRTDTLP